jgi:CubicO group peptidase (beta-lactamase class C family)
MTESSWLNRVWDGSLPDGWKPAFFYPDGSPMEAFVSTARDLTIFGNAVMNACTGLGVDESYRQRMTRASQALNPSYGLLWWVNSASLLAGVPTDAYAALGNGSQCVVVVPSLELVVARTGDEPDAASLGGRSFVDELVRGAVAEFGA